MNLLILFIILVPVHRWGRAVLAIRHSKGTVLETRKALEQVMMGTEVRRGALFVFDRSQSLWMNTEKAWLRK